MGVLDPGFMETELRRRGAGGYEQVGQSEGGASKSSRKGVSAFLVDQLYPRIQAAAFVALGVFVGQRSDFIEVVRFGEGVDRVYFNIGAVLFAINSIVAVYTILLLKYKYAADVNDWAKHAPNSVPLGTLIGIFSTIL
eukprot:c14794_g1_i1.p1 GENE.c14794_g1_i1~~c14794_g1_i1.p1  ORF type:complete len:138 (-),score=27.66 c14794_g1_i1:207-620(-)